MELTSRRAVLRTTGVALAAGLAGCSDGGTGGDGTEPTTDGRRSTPTQASDDRETTTQVSEQLSADTVRANCDSPTTLTRPDVVDGATLEAGCYRVNSILDVTSGTLTLRPGVHILFASEAGFDVKNGATISAEGAADNPVVLTGAEAGRGAWMGVRISGSTGNTFENTFVTGGGYNGWTGDQQTEGGVFADGSDVAVTIENSVFRRNHNAGIYADNSNADLTVRGCAFENNHRPMWIQAAHVPGLSELSFSGNDEQAVFIGAANGADQVSESVTWPDLGVPYRAVRLLNVTGSLEISAGTTIEFGSDTGLQVLSGGKLTAVGEANDMICFLGSEETPGHWRGISFKETREENKLAHVAVKHGGGRQWHGFDWSAANIFVHGGLTKATLTLGATVIEDSGWHGISIGRNAEFSCGSPTFAGNQKMNSYSASRDGPIPDCSGAGG